ncbi:nucleolus protein required for cell viability [Aspergillus sclerotioniger CBS 115572]|uniref:Nucleolus protein required for cell viability n=1 Tax=Aspergillus sclerotioniger CBS 115572 TaxID=1450535 RepID=A0A317VE10_9EURO|nr:nucleolus protein required for cell viability [Aspergillus sclerotioniger CBS 115572]PWY71501.1 nucleolus protein required for cell viability [Aspergillus sclerotioniger CBS 115572]
MTGATCIELAGTSPPDEVGLNDQDIEQLLYEAEDRLRPSNVKVDAAGAVDSADDGIDATSIHIPKLASVDSLRPYLWQHGDIAVVGPGQITENRKDMLQPNRHLAGVNAPKSSSKDKPTAGSAWFDLPKTELTTEFRRDLQLLRMRSVLDPKRHYKKEGGKAHPPKYSQVGTIIEGPTEFFSSRIAKRDRKKTFVEEALAVERENKRFEAKYRDIQTLKQSGKRSYYNKLRGRRNTKMK